MIRSTPARAAKLWEEAKRWEWMKGAMRTREQRKHERCLALVPRLVVVRQRTELGDSGGSLRGYRNGTKLVVSAGLVVDLDRLGRHYHLRWYG